MENQLLSEMEKIRQEELESALRTNPEQKSAEDAQQLLDEQNAEAEKTRLEDEQAKLLADEEAKKLADEEAAKVVASSDEKKSLFEALETPLEVKAEIPEAVKVELETVKSELEALKKEREQLEASDISKLLKSGLTLEQIAQGIVKTDYSNHSVEDLIKLELEKAGLKDTELETAIAEELATYESLSPLQKRKYDNELKASYKSEIKFDDTLTLLADKLKENAEKNKQPDPALQQKAMEAMKQSDLSEINNVFTSLKAQNYEISDDDIKTIVDKYDPIEADSIYTNNENKFDVNRWIKEKYVLTFSERDKKVAVELAEKRGYEKAKKEFANPDLTNVGGGAASATLSKEEQLKRAEDERLGRI